MFAVLLLLHAGLRQVAPGGKRRPDVERLAGIHPLGVGALIDDGNLTNSVARMEPPPRAKTLVIRIVSSGSSVVFSGDTAIHSPVAQFARATDLVIREAMTTDAIDCRAARISLRGEQMQKRLFRNYTLAENAVRIALATGAGAPAHRHLVQVDDFVCIGANRRTTFRPHWKESLHAERME